MKKVFFVIILGCLSHLAIAQSFSTGIKVGAGLGSASVKEVQNSWENDGINAGIHAGFFGRIKLGPVFVQPEIYYTLTKAQLSQAALQSNQVPETLELNFHRLDIPVMAGIRLSKVLRINGGPFASILIDTEAITVDQNVEEQIDDYYKRAVLGWQAGLGLDFLRFTVDARYETTLGNLRNFDQEDTNISDYLPDDQQQQQFVVSLGYILN